MKYIIFCLHLQVFKAILRKNEGNYCPPARNFAKAEPLRTGPCCGNALRGEGLLGR